MLVMIWNGMPIALAFDLSGENFSHVHLSTAPAALNEIAGRSLKLMQAALA